MKPYTTSRFATLWTCECEFQRDGNSIRTYEPLQTSAPPDAQIRCSSWDITFYDRHGNRQLETVRTHRFGLTASPTLCLIDGTWWEMNGGEVRQHNGQWVICRVGWRHTRAACMANAGWMNYDSGVLPRSWVRRILRLFRIPV
jgi:hypothetical protein